MLNIQKIICGYEKISSTYSPSPVDTFCFSHRSFPFIIIVMIHKELHIVTITITLVIIVTIPTIVITSPFSRLNQFEVVATTISVKLFYLFIFIRPFFKEFSFIFSFMFIAHKFFFIVKAL